MPRFVELEFPSFLECGVLSRGFLRVHCGSCRMDRVVGFSCKKRGCAHRVADAVWPKLPLTWWIEYHVMSRCGSGCCQSPTVCVTAWRMTPISFPR